VQPRLDLNLILLPLFSECWDYRHMVSTSALWSCLVLNPVSKLGIGSSVPSSFVALKKC
jgi:hypothetical protein